jgi:hypothetical protein
MYYYAVVVIMYCYTATVADRRGIGCRRCSLSSATVAVAVVARCSLLVAVVVLSDTSNGCRCSVL